MVRLRSIVEEDKGKLASTMIGGGYRRKAIVTLMKTWMVVSAKTGEARVEDVDKYSIMRRTGLPARDLRALDPHLSNPSSILGRERAIVVNLEHIKAIITSTEVLMINSSNPFFLRFLQDLQTRVPTINDVKTRTRISNDVVDGESEVKPLLDERTPLFQSRDDCDDYPNNASVEIPNDSSNNVSAAPKQLPFEFKALEACIESACICLECETQKLEDEAYPALDELTSEISTLNLERVRLIKNRLVALSGRVQKVADQLEHLLDDDNDMAEMYLTQKLDDRLLDQTSLKEGYNSTFDGNINESDDESDYDKSYDSKPDVEELEMLLEAYFAQVNGILQKLLSMSEYVGDTEDYINIMLDDKRNELLQVSITFSTINMIISAGIVVVGLFGMNIHIALFDGDPHYQFWTLVGCTIGGCILLTLVSIWWGKRRYFSE